MTGLFLHSSTDPAALVAELASRLGGVRSDPFAMEVVITPHPHVRRWLTNELAKQLGAPGEGVCAGVKFLTPGRLVRDLGDPVGFWQRRRLAWRLLRAVREHPEEVRLDQLRRHLAASRSSYPVALRIAGLFQRYLHWRPRMVERWEAGHDTAADGFDLGADDWQPVLWRLAAAEGSPVVASAEFRARLRSEPGGLGLPPSLSFFDPDPLSPWWLELLDALSAHRQLHLSVRGAGSATGHPAAARLTQFERRARQALDGRVAEHPLPAGPAQSGTLGWLQAALAGAGKAPPSPDGSVQVHGGHGLERQLEILRDAITGLLAAEPSLEPRDIIVGCPSPAAAAPLIQATFGLPSGVPGRHPANDFRVQLADRTSAEANPLVGVLVRALRLIAARATATEVIDFCAQPAVASRFDLDADSIQRLTRMATEAGVRWGLSAGHRAGFGLDRVPQNTWAAGLRRMLLGVAFTEAELPVVGTVLPLDDVEDGDLLGLGGLAELIERLAHLAGECEQPAPMAAWVTRLLWTLDAFALVSGTDVWQRGDAVRRITALSERGAGDEQLSLTAMTELLSDEFEHAEARSSFGNGALTVCSLRSLRRVPYRVVCLFGLDDGAFPRAPERDGDNLILRDPRPGEPDPPGEDRQALADAVRAAGEHLVIVHQSRSARTNEDIPPPAALADLLDLVAQAGVVERQHPLQPFSPSLYGADGESISYDQSGLRGAIALTSPSVAPNETAIPAAAPIAEVSLDDLSALVRDPVRHFLKVRCGLSYWRDDEPPSEIPVELDGLQRWAIGERVLALVRSGQPLDAAVRAEWLRGEVPPGQFGTRLLDWVRQQVAPIVQRFPEQASEPAEHHDLAVTAGGVPVTGRVSAHAGLVLQTTFAKPSASKAVGLWPQLLALAASGQPCEGMVLGRGGSQRWRSPDPDTARELLGRWVRLYQAGMDQPLPLPLGFGVRLASLLETGRDPFDELPALSQLYRAGRSAHWAQFYPTARDLLAVPRGQVDLGETGETSLAPAAARLIWGPIGAYEAVLVR